jgi:hypothetical protein
MLRGTTVNTSYHHGYQDTAVQLMKILEKKRPATMARDWRFHWDNAPVHTATALTDLMTAI